VAGHRAAWCDAKHPPLDPQAQEAAGKPPSADRMGGGKLPFARGQQRHPAARLAHFWPGAPRTAAAACLPAHPPRARQAARRRALQRGGVRPAHSRRSQRPGPHRLAARNGSTPNGSDRAAKGNGASRTTPHALSEGPGGPRLAVRPLPFEPLIGAVAALPRRRRTLHESLCCAARMSHPAKPSARLPACCAGTCWRRRAPPRRQQLHDR
jgi:hypothetical protein